MRSVGPNALQDVKDGKAKLTDPKYVAAAQALGDLGKAGYFGKGVGSLDYATAQDLFLQGKAAMYYMGSWALRDFNNAATNKIGADNVGFIPFPTVAGGAGNATQTPMNAGLTTVLSKKNYNAEVGEWLKYIVQHYGDRGPDRPGQYQRRQGRQPAGLAEPADQAGAGTDRRDARNRCCGSRRCSRPRPRTSPARTPRRLISGDMSGQDYMAALQKSIDENK